MKKILIVVIVIILMITFFSTLPFFRPAKADHSLSEFKKKGVIRIGYAVEAPYAFVSEDKRVTGESPEVAKVIVKQLGINDIEWYQSDFSALIDNLLTDKIDVIASGMFITQERAQQVSFSEPTFHVQQSMLVLRGNPLGIHSYNQAIQQGAKIAVVSGAVEKVWLSGLGMPENLIVDVPNASVGKVAVETGITDALALSSPTIHWINMHDAGGKAEIALLFDQVQIACEIYQGFGGFAFRKQDQELLRAWNEQLKNYVGSPEHLKLISAFGFMADDLPKNTSTQEIVSGS